MSREQVFKSHVRIEMESLDRTIRSLIRHHSGSVTDIMHKLLNDEYKFWKEYQNVSVILMEWVRFTNTTNSITMLSDQLKNKVWITFLRRLSMDAWLVWDKERSHGNELLRIMIETMEDVIYSQYPISGPLPVSSSDLFKIPDLQPVLPSYEREPLKISHRYGERSPPSPTKHLVKPTNHSPKHSTNHSPKHLDKPPTEFPIRIKHKHDRRKKHDSESDDDSDSSD